MEDLQLEPATAPRGAGIATECRPRQWVEPDWIRASNAEVARLSSLTPEERQHEWDALSPEERAAEDAAFDEFMQSLSDRRNRTVIHNPPVD